MDNWVINLKKREGVNVKEELRGYYNEELDELSEDYDNMIKCMIPMMKNFVDVVERYDEIMEKMKKLDGEE